jgi:hypothetical protein
MFSVNFSLETSAETAERMRVTVCELNNRFNQVICKDGYGDDIFEIIVGLICVSPDLVSGGFFKTRKPRYQRAKKTVRGLGGRSFVQERLYCWDIALDYSLIRELEEGRVYDHVIDKLCADLTHFSRFKSFDLERFTTDLSTARKQG